MFEEMSSSKLQTGLTRHRTEKTVLIKDMFNGTQARKTACLEHTDDPLQALWGKHF